MRPRIRFYDVIDRETAAIEAVYSQDTFMQVSLLSNYAYHYSDIHKYHRAAHLFQKFQTYT